MKNEKRRMCLVVYRYTESNYIKVMWEDEVCQWLTDNDIDACVSGVPEDITHIDMLPNSAYVFIGKAIVPLPISTDKSGVAWELY